MDDRFYERDIWKLCFFGSTIYANEYLLMLSTEEDAQFNVNCFNHRNGCEGSGYIHYDCELILTVDIPIDIKRLNTDIPPFIIDKFGKRTRNIPFYHTTGPFEILDLHNPDDWFNQFRIFTKEENRRIINQLSGYYKDENEVKQTSLF